MTQTAFLAPGGDSRLSGRSGNPGSILHVAVVAKIASMYSAMWTTACALMTHERFDALFITIYPTYPALLGPLLKRRFGVPFVLDVQDPWVGSWGSTVGPGANDAPDQVATIAATGAGQLPHTGYDSWAAAALGFLLVAGGVALRHRARRA